MYTDKIMYFMIGICLVMLVGVVFTRAFRTVLRLCFRGLFGTAAVFAINFFMSPWNIAVGINCFTAAVSALLGLPGVAMLFGWTLIFDRLA